MIRGMSDHKARLTVTIDPHLVGYAERLVATGKASSVSAVVNGALEARRLDEREARLLFAEAAERAEAESPGKVDRMLAHLDEQLAALPGQHRRQ